jgi:hypothetical protein
MTIQQPTSVPVEGEASHARTIAALKLAEIFREARNEADSDRMVEAVRALGATGSADAAETLKEIYDLSDPAKDRALQHEVIRALGDVARHAR